MNINTRHRHAIILPLFILCLSLSTGMGRADMSAAVADQSFAPATSDQPVQWLGARGVLAPGGSLLVRDGAATLEQGNALLEGEGWFSVQVGDAHIEGLAGSIYVSSQSDQLTVAALTSPALVSINGAEVLIPAGLQWKATDMAAGLPKEWPQWLRSRLLTPLPTDFLHAQQKRLDALPAFDDLPVGSTTVSSPLLTNLQLDASAKRTQEKWGEDLLGVIRGFAETHDSVSLTTLLSRQEAQQALHSTPLRLVVLPALSRDAAEPMIVQSLLPFFTDSSHRWLLASIHPSFRSSAALADGWSSLSGTEQAVSLFALPLSDVLPDALPSVLLQEWSKKMAAFSAAQDSSSFFDAYLPVLDASVSSLAAQGYPERASLQAKTAVALADSVTDTLSPKAQTAVGHLRQLSVPSSFVPTESTSSSSSVSSVAPAASAPEKVPSASEVEQTTHNALRDAHALFTVNTTVRATAPFIASIHSIVFSSTEGDRMINGDFDTRTMELQHITIDGKSLPYPMPLKKFVEWLKNDK